MIPTAAEINHRRNAMCNESRRQRLIREAVGDKYVPLMPVGGVLGTTLVVGVIAVAALSSSPSFAAGFGNDTRGCAYDRPCISDIARTTVGGILVEWNGQDNYHHYNVRWSRPGKGPVQVEVRGGSNGFFHLTKANTGTTYSFAVQGCKKALLQSSRCSPWESQQFRSR